MNPLFPPELRTASIVQRWSIVRTLNPDSVANHSFYVTFYALQIARLIQWTGPYEALTFAALMHDIEETFTGDVVSPVKRQIVDPGALSNFIEEQMKQRLPLISGQLDAIYDSHWATNIERIIKVADKVDAVVHLIIEQRMGNTVLKPLYDDCLENLVVAWHDLGEELYIEDHDRAKHREQWNDQIYPALQSHWKHGGVGIQ
jgi:5'-deoxynucleotidase YfbR-like HD superfamily hydrolase